MAAGAWERTAAQMALQANCNRDPKRNARAFKPDDFNPFAPRKHVDGWATFKDLYKPKVPPCPSPSA